MAALARSATAGRTQVLQLIISHTEAQDSSYNVRLGMIWGITAIVGSGVAIALVWACVDALNHGDQTAASGFGSGAAATVSATLAGLAAEYRWLGRPEQLSALLQPIYSTAEASDEAIDA